MKSTAKVLKAKKPAARKGPLAVSKPDPDVILLGGVLVKIPKPPGKPQHHTEREIRDMFRDYYASRKA